MARNPAKHYTEKPLDKWNAANFSQYLSDEHEKHFGIPYITRNIAAERKLIRTMVNEYGCETVKAFIDRCFREYKPTSQYPGLSFFFAYSYMRERVLSQILAEQKRQERYAQAEESAMSTEDVEAWL